MTKQQWLKRCETVYDMGLADRDLMCLCGRWLDFVLRLEHTLFSIDGQTEGLHILRFIEEEKQRLKKVNGTLASDQDGYGLIKFIAVLSHHCQQCAEDKKAWHIRSAFCQHQEKQ